MIKAVREVKAGLGLAEAKKLVEEAAETWMAARYEDDPSLALELSQVLYYVACMMAERRIALPEVYARL